MDIFRSYYSDPLTESSSFSDYNNYSPNRANLSDEEVMLASNTTPRSQRGGRSFVKLDIAVYRGVRKRNSGKWVCEVREPNKKSTIWLGTFPTAEMAARAHDVAAIALRGHSACLNFADSAWKLPIPDSLDSKDIRKGPVEAAEAFHPSEPEGISGDTPETPERMFFMDEEALFCMPGLLANMAEGLMLPPPQCSEIRDHAEADPEMPLWNYSI